MKRYFSLLMILCGFMVSSFASATELKVKGGDTLWKILAEVCQVAPSMQKARIFARATGIQTPGHIVIGDRIDVSRGCAAISDVHASLARVVAISVQQGETLRAMQVKTALLEAEVEKLRSDSLAPTKDQSRSLASASTQQFPITETRKFGGLDSVDLIWMALCLLVLFWLVFRNTAPNTVSDKGNEQETPVASDAHIDVSQHRKGRGTECIDHKYFDAGYSGGFIACTIPFTLAKYVEGSRCMKNIQVTSLWNAIPIYVDGKGYETFESDEEGYRVYAPTIDEFRKSVEESMRSFLNGQSDDIRLHQRIMAAISISTLWST